MKKNNGSETLHYSALETPIGLLYLVANANGLKALLFENTWPEYEKNLTSFEQDESSLLRMAKHQLTEYFAGRRKIFDLPLEFDGTEFQKQVWAELTKIPYGKTISYGEQAALIGRPKAVRAVGGTNGLNPISIVVPCHRVIGKSGALTGYAGGIERKKFLLQLEGIQV